MQQIERYGSQARIISRLDNRVFATCLTRADANNLYGHALSMPLPQRDFAWVEDGEKVLAALPTMDVNGSIGYVLEVDLVIPASIHDLVDDLPQAPERAKVTVGMLTPHMVEQLGSANYRGTEKLLLTHLPKDHYVIHFALLQFYLEMGVVVTKVHRCVQFTQSAFFEPYISFK